MILIFGICLSEYDSAFINRVVYLPFLNPIPKHKQDRYILEKMQTELPALCNHAIEAYLRLVSNNYTWSGTNKFQPDILITNSSIEIEKSVVLERFVESRCCFYPDSVISTDELQKDYMAFCNENNYRPIMGDRFSRELYSVLPSSVSRCKINNVKRGFKGLTLKSNIKN